jgi:hypothetical protein
MALSDHYEEQITNTLRELVIVYSALIAFNHDLTRVVDTVLADAKAGTLDHDTLYDLMRVSNAYAGLLSLLPEALHFDHRVTPTFERPNAEPEDRVKPLLLDRTPEDKEYLN